MTAAVNVPRLIYIGSKMLNFSESELMDMTLRKFFLIYNEYLEVNNLKEKTTTINDLP